MYKIKKEKPAVATPAQMAGSVGHMAHAARDNVTWLITGIAVAVVMVIAVGGYYWMRQQEDRAAEDLFHVGMKPFSQASPTAPPPRPEELQKAVEAFREILVEYPRSSAAPRAAYMLGNALSRLKDWNGAAKAYEDFLHRYKAHTSLVPLVYQRMAYVQLSQGKLEEAEKAFVAITKIPNAPNKDHALYELARINEMLNRPEGALAHYQELMKDHPRSPYTEEASIRIKTLDAKKAPPPVASPGQSQPSAQPPVR